MYEEYSRRPETKRGVHKASLPRETGGTTFGGMAGQPMLRALERYIEERGGDTFIFDRIADGESIGKIAKTITLPGQTQPISRPFLYIWRNKGGDERRKGWALAMEASADSAAEDAGDILDELAEETFDPSSGQVSLARARSEYRRWVASVRNKEKYGDAKSEVNVNLSLGDLHLDALRKFGSRSEPEEIEAADYELLPEDTSVSTQEVS